MIWYYTFGVNCKTEVQPLARPPVPLRQGPEAVHVQRRRPDPRPLGPAAGLRRRAGQPRRPAAGRHLDPAPAGPARRLPARRRHLVLPARGRHVQGAGRLPRLPDARAAAGPDHPRLLATRATWCSIRSPAAARRWPWPRSSAGSASASSCRRTTSARRPSGWTQFSVGDPLDGPADPIASAHHRQRPAAGCHGLQLLIATILSKLRRH